ncbi:MAG: transketolase [Omnitrophica WOR_2 bacterium SM23_29]|nr:MAG: transketolase [Omnitrophica WOR_2 bacterium SM23_29]
MLEGKLKNIAQEARKLIIEVACRAKTPHIGSSLSCVDLLVALYFYELKVDPKNWKQRDIFVLSKAHAELALYTILTIKGIMSRKKLINYFQDNGTLPAHLDRITNRGIEVSTGSLGHGFNIALGMAYGYKIKGDKRRVFTLIGDGESEEGSIWEGALFAGKLKIDNFTAIIDYNNLQGYGRPREICYYEPVIDKWKSFGWEICRIDGHNFSQIIKAFKTPHKGKPKIIVADTIKGKGVDFMEDKLKWHYFIVTEELKQKALTCLDEGNHEK